MPPSAAEFNGHEATAMPQEDREALLISVDDLDFVKLVRYREVKSILEEACRLRPSRNTNFTPAQTATRLLLLDTLTKVTKVMRRRRQILLNDFNRECLRIRKEAIRKEECRKPEQAQLDRSDATKDSDNCCVDEAKQAEKKVSQDRISKTKAKKLISNTSFPLPKTQLPNTLSIAGIAPKLQKMIIQNVDFQSRKHLIASCRSLYQAGEEIYLDRVAITLELRQLASEAVQLATRRAIIYGTRSIHIKIKPDPLEEDREWDPLVRHGHYTAHFQHIFDFLHKVTKLDEVSFDIPNPIYLAAMQSALEPPSSSSALPYTYEKVRILHINAYEHADINFIFPVFPNTNALKLSQPVYNPALRQHQSQHVKRLELHFFPDNKVEVAQSQLQDLCRPFPKVEHLIIRTRRSQWNPVGELSSQSCPDPGLISHDDVLDILEDFQHLEEVAMDYLWPDRDELNAQYNWPSRTEEEDPMPAMFEMFSIYKEQMAKSLFERCPKLRSIYFFDKQGPIDVHFVKKLSPGTEEGFIVSASDASTHPTSKLEWPYWVADIDYR
ncbi:hypothetical protein HD806DRAFT_542242 [Xylariaceae sp. AK1471]|nr:hypothetical protein HD806DRAFT_542242 [Xylariaceae sp. AK1471]